MKIKNQFIVSCQALSDEPLHSSYIMGKMAKAAQLGGAGAIRANSISDIKAIKQEVNLPIIGIIKKEYDNSPIHITPTMDEVTLLIEEGCEIIAMDCTSRVRPKESLEKIVDRVKKIDSKQLIMADCATLEDVKLAIKLNFDIIAPTLVGYTETTKEIKIAKNNFQLLKEMLDLSKKHHKLFFAEGNIDTPEKSKLVLELGCDAVVVGSMITRPQLITKKFIDELKK